MLHCLKIKQVKESEHFGPYRDSGFLPLVKVTMLHYSHTCLHETEENPLVPFIFKGIEEEKAKLPAHLSLSSTTAFRVLPAPGLWLQVHFTNSPHPRQPTIFHNPLRVLLSNSSWYPSPISKDSHYKSELTTTGVLLLSVFCLPK